MPENVITFYPLISKQKRELLAGLAAPRGSAKLHLALAAIKSRSAACHTTTPESLSSRYTQCHEAPLRHTFLWGFYEPVDCCLHACSAELSPQHPGSVEPR